MTTAGTSGSLLVALALVAPALAGCLFADPTTPLQDDTPPATGDWSREGQPERIATLGDPATSGLDTWPGPFESTPEMHDLDGDGTAEIIAQSADRSVYVFDPTDGRAVATLETQYPPAWHTEMVLNSVEAATLAPGEPPSVVVTNHAAYLSVWTVDPDRSTSDDLAIEKRWEARMDACTRSPSMDGGPTLADLDGDDALEILVQIEEVGLFAFDPDGTELWHHCWGGGNSAPAAGDLDGDGRAEAVFASDSGLLAVFDGTTGDPRWTIDVTDHGVQPGSISQAPTVADIDGTAPKEVLFTAREASVEDPDRYDENDMAIVAARGNLTTGKAEIAWMRQPSWANPLSNTKLIVDDVDDDGRADIFGMDWNTIGHRPGDWERLGPANVFRLASDGTDVWVREIGTWWSDQNIALGDADGDGNPEVLVNGPGEGGDGTWMLDAATGKAVGFLPVSPWQTTRGPQIVDLDGDGGRELVIPIQDGDDRSPRGAILVYQLAPGDEA